MTRPNYGTVGSVVYNGYNFAEPIKSKVNAVFIRDSADRVTKYVKYTLEVEFYVFPEDDVGPSGRMGAGLTGYSGNPTDTQFLDIRSRLSATGKDLSFTSMGFGNDLFIVVGGGSGVKDVAFGPKPKILHWLPIGTNRAAKCLWVCETTIPECLDRVPAYQNAVAELTFERAWNINREGMSTVITSGTLEIAAHLIGGALTDTVDYYRSRLAVIRPFPGFHREQSFHISRDKRTLEFTFTDTEIPSDNPYLPYLVNIDVTHSISTRSANNAKVNAGVEWSNVISGSIQVAAGMPKALAWEAFRQIVAARCAIRVAAKNQQSDRAQFLTGITIEDSLFSRRIRFELSFYMVSSIQRFFTDSGIFKAVSRYTWDQWTDSLYSLKINHIRGVAGLGHTPGEEIIISLCEPSSLFINNIPEPKPVPDGFAFLQDQPPDPIQSWPKFDNNLELHVIENGSITHKYQVGGDGGWVLDQQPQGKTLADKTLGGPYASIMPQSEINLPIEQFNQTQVRSVPTYKVIMWGEAERVCYDIPIPRLVSVGGARAIRKHGAIRTKIKIYDPINPVKIAMWRLEYELESPPNFAIAEIETDGGYNYVLIGSEVP